MADESKTEAKQTEQEIQRLASFPQINPQPILEMDLDGRITFYNQAALEVLGETRKAADLSKFLPDDLLEILAKAKQTGEMHFQREVVVNDAVFFESISFVEQFKALRLYAVDITERKRAEEALRRLNVELEQRVEERTAELRKQAELLDLAHDAIIVRDLDSQVIFWSRGAEETYGWTKDQAMGQSVHALLKTQFSMPRVEIERKVIKSGRWEGELRHTKADGVTIVVASRLALQRDAQGEPKAIMEINRDITERKRAETILHARLKLLKFAESYSQEEFPQATLDELEALTGSTIGFYHLVDADQRTLLLQTWSTNTLRNMCTATGKGRHYDIAEAGVWTDCVPQRRPVIHNNYAALPHRKGLPPGHAPVVRELVVPILRGDKVVAIIGVGNKLSDYDEQDVEVVSRLGDFWWDIAKRKRAEAEILKLNEELEQRVKERTAELESANKELDTFSYSVSHDLKAPVRAIEGFSRILMRKYSATLESEPLRMLNVIESNTRRMSQLIDDLLTFSRTSRKKVMKAEINLYAMTAKAFEQLRHQTPERVLQLNIGELPPAMGDPSLIEQVMVNLLSNAIKFTSSRKTAVIEVGGRTEGKEIIYYVKDNGTGFDEQYAHKLYEVFQRLHSYDEYEGSGVGLAIVKSIIQRHNGRVWAEGKLNQGATFYFTLPKNAD